jgi:hypothetical protein
MQVDLTGKRFGLLVITGRGPDSRRPWLYVCDCGNTGKAATGNLLRRIPPQKSCGCVNLALRVAGTKRLAKARSDLEAKTGVRKCPACKSEKPLADFLRVGGRSRSHACSECMYLRHISREYGLAAEDYRSKLDAQSGRCAICGVLPERIIGRSRGLVVDHDHVTGKARDLLCMSCNSLLGLCWDEPARVAGLIAYADKHIGGQLSG